MTNKIVDNLEKESSTENANSLEHNIVFPSYLILTNIGKRHNFGTLLRSAAAFGVKEVFVVGEKKLKTFGHQGTACHLKLTFFANFPELRKHLEGITICGIELRPDAVPVDAHPFSGPTAFMLGNEGTGMTETQMNLCDQFVYIPQYSSATASLNVAIAGSIVLHHYAIWARFKEATRIGSKFQVSNPRSSLEAYSNPTATELSSRLAIQLQRRMKHVCENNVESLEFMNTGVINIIFAGSSSVKRDYLNSNSFLSADELSNQLLHNSRFSDSEKSSLEPCSHTESDTDDRSEYDVPYSNINDYTIAQLHSPWDTTIFPCKLFQSNSIEIFPIHYHISRQESIDARPFSLSALSHTAVPLFQSRVTQLLDKTMPSPPKGWDRVVTVDKYRPDGHSSITFVFLANGPIIKLEAKYDYTLRRVFVKFIQPLPTTDIVQSSQSIEHALLSYFLSLINHHRISRRQIFHFQLRLRYDLMCGQSTITLEPDEPRKARTQTRQTHMGRILFGQLSLLLNSDNILTSSPAEKPILSIFALSFDGSFPFKYNNNINKFDFTPLPKSDVFTNHYLYSSFGNLCSLLSLKTMWCAIGLDKLVSKYPCSEAPVLNQSGMKDICIYLGYYGPKHLNSFASGDRIMLQCLGVSPVDSWIIYTQMVTKTRSIPNGNGEKESYIEENRVMRFCTSAGWSEPKQLYNEAEALKYYKGCVSATQ